MRISIRKKIITIYLFYAFLILTTPILVNYFKEDYYTSGWMAIGSYTFDFIDGLTRSFYFLIITSIPILTILHFLPLSKENNEKINIKESLGLSKPELNVSSKVIYWLLILISLVFFSYNLGITGVETPTPYKLSGIAHYLRTYIFPLILVPLLSKGLSFRLTVIYSIVVGITSASRFTLVTPIILYALINRREMTFRILLKVIFFIVIFFSFLTYFRSYVLFRDEYTFSKLIAYTFSIDNDEQTIKILLSYIHQIFIRIGLARDVILSMEVRELGFCQDYINFFLNGSGSTNSAMDFYGVDIGNGRFGISSPTLPSLVALSNNNLISLFFSVVFSLIIFIELKLIKYFIVKIFPDREYFPILYLFFFAFSIIGPLLFGHLLTAILFITQILKKTFIVLFINHVRKQTQ
ncbi:MAG: hypothetical protein Q8S23_04050 [Bacteroidales bacterium]|nr:hypothetical protein [Bacteroidales bacterium]